MLLNLNRLTAALGYAIAMLGFIPLFPHVHNLPKLLFISGFAVGIIGDRREKPLIPSWMLTVISLLLFFWYGIQFSRHNPALPIVNILVALLAVRLTAEKTPRTWLQIYAISLFALSSSSLFDLGPRFLVLLSLLLPLLALSLVLLTFKSFESLPTITPRGIRLIIGIGLLMPVISLLLIPAFFPILPRTQYPLWNFIQQTGPRQTGLSESVSPGNSSRVSDTGPLAFRAEMQQIEPRLLYWRVSQFSRLKGLEWLKDPPSTTAASMLPEKTVNQTITMEPSGSRTLVALDMPISLTYLNGGTINNAIWSRPLPSSRRMRFEAKSIISGRYPATQPVPLELLTRLPQETPPRLLQLASQFNLTGLSSRQKLDRIENWFRLGNFRYSRTDLPTGPFALDQFLFEKKAGHCEFYASTFALLLRGAGVPARLAGGYLGGDYNELGSYYRVSEERAHVWVEAYLEGEGWQRIDPSSFAVNADSALGPPKQRSLGLRMRLLMDSLDHAWNSAVITYDFERQLETASRVHGRLQGLSLSDLKKWGITALVATTLILSAFKIFRLAPMGTFRRESRILKKFRKTVQRDLGIPVEKQLGLFELAETCRDERVSRFVEIYAAAIYRDIPLTNAEYIMLKSLLKEGFKR